MITIMGCHFIFFLVLKWTFYRHRYHKPKGDDASGSGNGSGFSDMDDGTDDAPAASFDDVGSERW